MADELQESILAIALEDDLASILVDVSGGANFIKQISYEEFEENFDDYNDESFDVVVCGSNLTEEQTTEFAQILRNQCPFTPILYASFDKANYTGKKLVKNGFSETYLLPVDLEPFKNKLLDNLSTHGRKKRIYRNVRLVDIEANTTVNFDTYVYLPLNKRYIKFSTAETEFGEKRMGKLSEKGVGTIYVEQSDLNKFYEYTAEHLKGLVQGKGQDEMSVTERDEKLQESIRSLYSDIFDSSIKADFTSGKEMIVNCQKIVNEYITGGSKQDWYSRLISTVGGNKGGYNHAANVSTFAALFAIGLKHPKPEDLAMAGFLHDLALADFPQDLLKEPMDTWPEDERRNYLNHPEKTVNLIKERKMIISAEVEQAILQHHEMFTGKGFPQGLQSFKISEEAQILSFADQFDYLTSHNEGDQVYSPRQALEKIAGNGSIKPELISRLRKLIPKDNPESKNQEEATG